MVNTAAFYLAYNELCHAAMASKTTSVTHDSTVLSFHIVGPTQQKGKGKTAKCQNICFCYNYCAYNNVFISIHRLPQNADSLDMH